MKSVHLDRTEKPPLIAPFFESVVVLFRETLVLLLPDCPSWGGTSDQTSFELSLLPCLPLIFPMQLVGCMGTLSNWILLSAEQFNSLLHVCGNLLQKARSAWNHVEMLHVWYVKLYALMLLFVVDCPLLQKKRLDKKVNMRLQIEVEYIWKFSQCCPWTTKNTDCPSCGRMPFCLDIPRRRPCISKPDLAQSAKHLEVKFLYVLMQRLWWDFVCFCLFITGS